MDERDWFEIDEFGDGWWRITEGDPVLRCHSFLVRDGDDAVLIDTGLGIEDLPSVVEGLAGIDVPVVLTHSHWDHIGAAHRFDDVAIHGRERTADGRVAIDVLSEEFGQRPTQFVDDWLERGRSFPAGFEPDSYAIEAVDGVDSVEPGEEIAVGDRSLETVPIPGHSPGQLAVLDRTAGICHAADVLEPGGEVFAQFDDSDLGAYLDTINRLIDLRDEGAFDTMTISHGDPLTGNDLAALDDVRTALERILEGETGVEMVETHWGTVRESTVGNVTVLYQ
ncbi:MBL fold metallo-hydrolase [Natrarchaeobius sp. A-rgal3]|uniref:MBL fold metallo-hydrolase n=1 Tax=Natrarchaeobius versutus TaxID=1679078 RepID=UPI00350EF301